MRIKVKEGYQEPVVLHKLEGHTQGILTIAFSPDGKTLASGSRDTTIRLWNVDSGKCIGVLKGHEKRVNSIAFNATGEYLISGSDDETVRIWDIASHSEIDKVHFNNFDYGEVFTVRISTYEPLIAVGLREGLIYLLNWDLQPSKSSPLRGHTNRVTDLSFSLEEKILLSASYDGTVRLWDITTGSEISQWSQGESLSSTVFAWDYNYVVTGSENGKITILDAKLNGNIITFSDHTEYIWSICPVRASSLIISGSQDESIRLSNLEDSQQIVCIENLPGSVNAMGLSPDGRMLAYGMGRSWEFIKELEFQEESIIKDYSVYIWDFSSVLPTTQEKSGEIIYLKIAIRRIRKGYTENKYLGICYWFDEFDRYVYRGNFQVCEGLLKEIREQGYPLSSQEKAYVDSREGVLQLKQGIKHHKQTEFEEAQKFYQSSLEIQKRVGCKNAQSDVELFQSFLEDDWLKGEADPKLESFAEELRVLGGSENVLCERLTTAAPEERSQILLAAVEARLTKPLLQAVSSEDEQTRMMGMAGLARFTQIEQVQVLLDGLQDPNWFVRWRAAEALGQQKDTANFVVEALCKALKREIDPEVRRVLVVSLQQKGNSAATPALVAALNDPDPNVRIAVIETLAKLGDRHILPQLRIITDDNVRMAIIEALAKAGDRHILPQLQMIADDKDFFGNNIKEATQKAIKEIEIRHSLPSQPVESEQQTYSDGFPKHPLAAIEASFFLSEAEKQEWREWLFTATPENKNELVDILHQMWQYNSL